MPSFCKEVDVDIDVPLSEVFEQITDDELMAEANRRCIEGAGSLRINVMDPLVERAYYDAAKTPGLPESIRTLLCDITGRVL